MNTLLEAIKESLKYDVNKLVIPFIYKEKNIDPLRDVIYFLDTYVPPAMILPKNEANELLEDIRLVLGIYGFTNKTINNLINDYK